MKGGWSIAVFGREGPQSIASYLLSIEGDTVTTIESTTIRVINSADRP